MSEEKELQPQFLIDDESEEVTETKKEKKTKKKLKKEKKQKEKKTRSGKPNVVIYIVSVLIMIGLIYHSYQIYTLLASYTFLPEKYIRYGLIGLIVVNVFFSIYAFLPVNNLNKILQSILCAVLAFALAFASTIIPEYKGRMERLFTEIPSEGEMNINVYVLSNSDIQGVKDLEGRTVAIQTTLDSDYQDYALLQINHELVGAEINKVEYEDIYSELEGLYNKEVDAIILNESYVQILASNADFETFREDTRQIYSCIQKIQLEFNLAEVGDITSEPFIIMCGGNDEWTYGDVLANDGRTDVNLLMVVNPNTKQILMISIPRDSYLGLWGNANRPDKLTHATWYGIDCWLETINGAFDVNINHFIRICFSSLINIVDSIGGIDLYNEYEFYTRAHWTYDEKKGAVQLEPITFPVGEIHLNGAEALAYVREREHLPNGDFGRNKHQAIVLKALIDKVTTVDGISHISDLMEAVEGTFSTDITMDQIYALAQMQLDDMANWSLVQYSCNGSTGPAPSYIMGLNSGTLLSMVFLYDNSINQAKTYIRQIMNNEIVVIE